MLALATLILTAAAFVAAAPSPVNVEAANQSVHPMYSSEWLEDALTQYLNHPNKPSTASVHAEFAERAAAFSCPAPAFKCTPYADDGVKATDVDHVRPKDISTVMAIGDSITAGFGMNSGYLPFTTITEYRGLSFSIGGDSNAITLANHLKHYNTAEMGAATGTTALGATIDVLDAAVSGAVVSGLGAQITTLTNAFNKGSYKKDGWKLLTVLIGANDLCRACQSGGITAASFETDFRSAMSQLNSTYTNMIVSQVHAAQQGSSYCSFAQGILKECPCAADSASAAQIDALAPQINAAVSKVAAEFNGRRSDFAIRVQPGISAISGITLDWLAKIDCFHPNQCAHQSVAGMLWNNLFQ
ncbi:hypothetical protein HK101_004702, partial [Irineochytrium annulatum]